MAYEMQQKIQQGVLFSCGEVFEKYRESDVQPVAHESIVCSPRRLFRKLYSLELLREDWEPHLRETEYILYGRGRKGRIPENPQGVRRMAEEKYAPVGDTV
ncbi:MAG: hypothetical protein V8S08_01475 [Lachnoclostridium sp.]